MTDKAAYLNWVDTLPDGWEAKPLRSVARYRISSVNKIPVEGETAVRLCNYTDVYYNEEIHASSAFMAGTATDEELAKFRLHVGDVLITKDSESWDDIAIPALVRESAADLICGYHLALLRPDRRRLTGEFLLRCLQADNVNRQFQIAASGVTRYGIPKSAIGRAVIPVPPLATQQSICSVLSRAIEDILALIAKKQRLIELLTEKRSALIARAITQGLDPSVPMKDSGVAWLGPIPAHWREHRLSGVAEFISGSTPTIDRLDYWDGEIPWASAKDMKVSYLAQTEDHITETALREWGMHLLQPQAVLLVVRGMILLHSLPVAVSQVPMTINQDMKALKVRPSLCLPEFLMRWLQGSKHGIASLIEQSAHGTRCLRTDLLKQVRCFLPGLEEQTQICNYITDKSAALEATGSRLSAAIDRLREYRSALITSAVTGQLNLREHERTMV